VYPYCSAAARDGGAPLIAKPHWWMLCVGMQKWISRLAA
jgi:hypothetical protein